MRLPMLVTVLGLLLDFVGVMIVGWLGEIWHMVYADGRSRIDANRRRIYRTGWALIAVGFLLQALAVLLR